MHDASDWRSRPRVCVDQNNEPDACGELANYLNP